MCLIDDYCIVAVFLAFQFAERVTEFLNGADDDASAFIDCLGEFLAAPADVFHNTGFRGESVDVVRHIRIEHDAVRHHDDGIKDRSLVGVDEVNQLVCKPCHRLCLAASRRMLDKVVVAGTILSDPLDEVAYHAQLMVAREISDAFAVALHVFDEVVQNVEQRICLPYIAPQIACGVIARHLGIDRIHVEWQKCRILAVEEGGHECVVIVNNKMHQCRAEHRILRIAVVAVLPDAVGIVLVRTFVFQFGGDNRETVEKDT